MLGPAVQLGPNILRNYEPFLWNIIIFMHYGMCQYLVACIVCNFSACMVYFATCTLVHSFVTYFLSYLNNLMVKELMNLSLGYPGVPHYIW